MEGICLQPHIRPAAEEALSAASTDGVKKNHIELLFLQKKKKKKGPLLMSKSACCIALLAALVRKKLIKPRNRH